MEFYEFDHDCPICPVFEEEYKLNEKAPGKIVPPSLSPTAKLMCWCGHDGMIHSYQHPHECVEHLAPKEAGKNKLKDWTWCPCSSLRPLPTPIPRPRLSAELDDILDACT